MSCSGGFRLAWFLVAMPHLLLAQNFKARILYTSMCLAQQANRMYIMQIICTMFAWNICKTRSLASQYYFKGGERWQSTCALKA
jgi:hypothetical protein